MRRVGAGAVVLLLLLTSCTGTITTNTQWSGSWEETFTLTASYEDGGPDSILIDVNGCLLVPLARGETSARATIHLLGLPGVAAVDTGSARLVDADTFFGQYASALDTFCRLESFISMHAFLERRLSFDLFASTPPGSFFGSHELRPRGRYPSHDVCGDPARAGARGAFLLAHALHLRRLSALTLCAARR